MTKQFTLILFILAGFISRLSAQIPNADFSTWDTVSTYIMPQDWDNMNNVTSTMNIYTCTKGAPGVQGNPYLILTTHNVSAMGLVAGVASPGVLNKYDKRHPIGQSGFPYTDRPVYFSGLWQYMATGNDQGYISVMLSKWDSTAHMRDTIAYALYKLPGMVMVWEAFNIPLVYTSSASPDSAMIILSASGNAPLAGSYIYADELTFSNTLVTTGINDLIAATDVSVYPNPASSQLTIETGSTTKDVTAIQLIDVTGRTVYELTGDNSNIYTIHTRGLATGTYFVKVQTAQGSTVKKVVVE